MYTGDITETNPKMVLWPWPSTFDPKTCAIRCLALTVSDVCLRLICSQSTSIYSALEVSHFMCYTNLQLTYLLSYLPTANIVKTTTQVRDLMVKVAGSRDSRGMSSSHSILWHTAEWHAVLQPPARHQLPLLLPHTRGHFAVMTYTRRPSAQTRQDWAAWHAPAELTGNCHQADNLPKHTRDTN